MFSPSCNPWLFFEWLLILHVLFNPSTRMYSAFSSLNMFLKLQHCLCCLLTWEGALAGEDAETLGVPFVFGMETQKCTQNKNSALHA